MASKKKHEPVAPPTEVQVEHKKEIVTSAYLNQEEELRAEIDRANVEGRKPDLSPYDNATVERVNPKLLTKGEVKEFDNLRGGIPGPNPAGVSHIEAQGDEDWRLKVNQDNLIKQDESDPAVPVKQLEETGEDKKDEDEPVKTVQQRKDDPSVPVKSLEATEVKKEEAKEQAKARTTPSEKIVPNPTTEGDDRNPAAKVQMNEDNADEFKQAAKGGKKKATSKRAAKPAAKKASAAKKTAAKKVTQARKEVQTKGKFNAKKATGVHKDK